MSTALLPAPPASSADANAPRPAGMCFGDFPITERAAFPPADDRRACWVYVTLNAEIALSLPGSTALQHIVRSSRARISVDGQWLWWALRRKYPDQALRKLSGSDLIHTLATHAATRQRRLLLLGSSPERNAAAVMRLRERNPGLQIAGFAPPSYTPGAADEAQVQQEVQRAVAAWRPDYIVLGLGAAREHRLAWRLAPVFDGQVSGLLCFGGAIDFASGNVRRAPAWWQRSGLEGLYRVLQQPQRLWRLLRVLRVLPLLGSGRY